MATIKEVYQAIDRLAPFHLQLDFDNSGFLVGRGEGQVTKILVSLDITPEVAAEAAEIGAELIVSHHPVIFNPVRQLTDENGPGRLLLTLAERGIGAVCAHTNLDAVQGGVNDCLARALKLSDVEQLSPDGEDEHGNPYGIGRVGNAHVPGLSAGEYAAFVKGALGSNSVRFVDGGKPVRRVAVGGGSCGEYLADAVKKGCDTFVTSDLRYHIYQEAKELGITLMDAGHYPTEQVVCAPLAAYLRTEFPAVEVLETKIHREIYNSLGGEEIT